MSLSRDGKQLVTGSCDATAKLWDVDTGRELVSFGAEVVPRPEERDFYWIESVAISGDGKWLVTGCADKTARVWDTSSGKQIRVLRGHTEPVTSVSISRDDRLLVTGGSDNTCLWEVATGRKLNTITTPRLGAHGHAFLSGDGKWIATAGNDKTARLLQVGSGKEVAVFRHSNAVEAVFLSEDGQWLVTGSTDRTAQLWEVATGRQVQVFRGDSDVVSSVRISADGKMVASGSWDATARVWDVTRGTQIRIFKGQALHILSVFLSSDGKTLVTGASDGSARLWDVATTREVKVFVAYPFVFDPIDSVCLSTDGKWLVTAHHADMAARLWDTVTGKVIRTFSGHKSAVRSVCLSTDGTWLVTGSWDKTVRLWNVATGRERQLLSHPELVNSVCLSRDDRWLATGNGDNTARLWEVATGNESRVFRGHSGHVASVWLSADAKWLATGSDDCTARLWDTSTGNAIRRFRGHFRRITSVCLSSDGRWLITGSEDHTIRLWDVGSGKEICRLINFRDSSWAVIDRDGRFDTANGGKVDNLHWVVGTETIALGQLKQRYYDPGLLAKYLGTNKEPLRVLPEFRETKLHPSVEVSRLSEGTGHLTLKLANRGGGIGRVQIYVNGRELTADARGPEFNMQASTATVTVDLAGAVAKPGEKNHVRVVTWNSEGYLSSRGLDLEWNAPGRKQQQPIELHAIVVGVADYASEALKLRYPGKDAADFAKALHLGGKRLFGADKTHVTLLCDGGPPGALSPMRENIEKAFDAARKCRPTDVLVVYLAGHGVALQEQGQEIYCYLTREARTVNQDSFRDPAVRRQSAVTSAELTEWFKKIPALKQVLILDTCAAGAAAGKLIEHRDISADQIRAIDRLRDRTGFHVLMGCAADRVSYEATRYSQGVLTYALLQAMRGAKLRNGEFIDVMDLFQYAADQVPQLAQHIGGIQKPFVMAPRGTSFDIGQLKKEDQQQIPLALIRPLLLRPHLINADKDVLDDDLGLKGRLRQRLNDASHAAARGRGAPAAVYVDADEMPGAVRPTGSYTVEGKTIRVRLNLRRDGQNMATLQVDGSRDELDALADRLSAAILKNLGK